MKYSKARLSDYIEFNPKEQIPKGVITTEVSMANIEPFTKHISNKTKSMYRGGMKFRNGDTIVARITPCLENGKTAYVDILKEDEVGFGSTEYIVLRAIPNKTVPEFIYYLARSDKFREKAISLMTGTSGRQRVQTDALMQEEFDFPSICDQKKIATVLSLLDEKIRCNNRTNDNLHDMAEILFREVYKKGHNGKLERFLSNIESGARPKGGAESAGVPSIGAEKIERFGIYDYSSEKYISKDFYNKMKRGRIKNGDVLLYKDGAYTGKSSMVLDGFPHKEAAVNEHVFILNTENNFAQFYLYFCINIAENREKLHTLASGKAAQPGLNQSELGSIDIMIPDRNSILDFENSISPIMHQIASNAQENRRLTKLRDTLLPELLNGKIDISNIDI